MARWTSAASTRCLRAASRSTPAWCRSTGLPMWWKGWRGILPVVSRPTGSARWCATARAQATTLPPAEARYASLKERFGEDVVLVHGQLSGDEKDAAMARFAAGGAKLLVATTVIEVGVDVPSSTLMVIEQAERFGLAQLHQLRGRVGRGSEKSVCLLLRGGELSEVGKQRPRPDARKPGRVLPRRTGSRTARRRRTARHAAERRGWVLHRQPRTGAEVWRHGQRRCPPSGRA